MAQCSSCGGFCKKSGCEREDVGGLIDDLRTEADLLDAAAAKIVAIEDALRDVGIRHYQFLGSKNEN